MKKSFLVLIVSVALIFSLGLTMVFNTTAAEIIDRASDANLHTALYKQIFYGFMGLILGLFVYRAGHARFLQWSVPLLIFVTCLLVLLFIPGVGVKVNGARRWLSIFGFSFQPSECAKLLIPAVYIHWFIQQKSVVDFRSFIKILLWLAIPTGLILMEPDNGTAAILVCMMTLLFLLTKIYFRYWALPLACLVSLGGFAAWQMPHVHDRIQVFLHPEMDLLGKGHQSHQAKIAAGSGGIFGRGLGESLQKLNYLPEARNDYIAAIYAEETGFIGMLCLIALYIVFSYAGCSTALKTPHLESFLLAAIVTFLISIQAFLNLGIVSGLLPSKGMTLPFFSQGGSSLIVNFVAVFLLLDISRKSMYAKA